MAERVWCKTLLPENFWGYKKRGEIYPLEEPVWRDNDTGEPQYTKGGEPKGRPGWEPSQKVVLYVAGSRCFPALVEIISHPGMSGNDDWPWTTDATVIKITEDGPTLKQIGVPAEMVERRVRWPLSANLT